MIPQLAFWGRHVMDPTPAPHCREWPLERTKAGYGRIRLSSTSEVRVNGITCTAWHGGRPTGSMVLHSCNNPGCWAGEHLRWGTAQENMDDRLKDGTNLAGEDHPSAKLTRDQVDAIRAKHANGTTMYALAKKYGCTVQNISRIIKWETWK